jgi:2,4-dienoyl-CoA reductase-like NADH-dependent reductase (Old Yellow Enzyme family)
MDESALRERVLLLPHARLLAALDAREVEELEMGWRERVVDTHLPHIADLPRALPPLFAAAARRAREAGFDGVELHCAHAYTLASFLSRTNDRADGYGGSNEARARLPLEVLRAVRAAVGADWVVGARILGEECIAGGSTIDDATEHALRLSRAGLDFLSVSRGGKFEDARQPKVGEAAYPYTGPSGHACMPTIKSHGDPRGANLHLSRAIRAALRADGLATPVVGAGGIDNQALAEQALADGSCDLVAAARQSLADPDWWRKLELSREHEVRRCSYTNYCEGLDQRHKQVTCRLWDRDHAERDADGGLALSHDGRRRLLAPPWNHA